MSIESINTPKNTAIIVPLGLISLFLIFIFSGCSSDSRAGTGLSSRNLNNEWTYKYNSLTGSVSGGFVARNDNSQIIYESYLQEGDIEFELYDTAGNLLTTFSGNNVTDTLDGFFKKGKEYRVRANVRGAKNGDFHFKMK